MVNNWKSNNQSKQMDTQQIYKIVEEITAYVEHSTDFEKTCRTLIQNYPNIEAIYVLDSKGFMITDTVLRPGSQVKSPAKKGDRLSDKPYFKVCSDLKTDIFVTYPYVSSATGSICRTATRRIRKQVVSGKNALPMVETCYLCIDFIEK